MTEQTRKMLNALIVDDEAAPRRALRKRLQKLPDVTVLDEALDGRQALELIQRLEPDLVFLDTHMPGMNAFDVIAALADGHFPAVILLTVSDGSALETFEASAVDYLRKPYKANPLRSTLDRVQERLDKEHHRARRQALHKLLRERENARLAIRDGGKTTWVRQADIQWIDAAGDYMCVHVDGETHIMRKTMKALEQELITDCLQRIHRSTIVNVKRVSDMQSHINGEYFLILDNGHTLKLSRSYREKLKYLG